MLEVQLLFFRGIVNATTLGTITNTVNALLNGTIKNSTTATTGVVTNSSLGVTKSDSPDPVTAGEVLLYAMSITNNGPSLARNVSFTDSLPTALTVQYRIVSGYLDSLYFRR